MRDYPARAFPESERIQKLTPVFRAGCILAESSEAQSDNRPFRGVDAMPYNLIVNGRTTSVDVPADMPLLWVIRDVLKLSATKFGCGIGQCRACTVHLRGQPQRSCLIAVADAADTPITTLEGLSADGTHPVQIAWQDIDVPQCGYCQAGQMMAAAALLSKNPKPTDADIDAAMTGNLCRCGTYLRIREAVHRAATIAASVPTTQAAQNAAGKQ
jgi:isoquinoline 1-oxidoreductase alpha subunit